jgi:hypothetical protein
MLPSMMFELNSTYIAIKEETELRSFEAVVQYWLVAPLEKSIPQMVLVGKRKPDHMPLIYKLLDVLLLRRFPPVYKCKETGLHINDHKYSVYWRMFFTELDKLKNYYS